MDYTKDIEKQIRAITIETKRLMQATRVGDARSAQKGFGLEFDQIREYMPGDDVRFIDWKSSARSNKILVKEYTQERSRTIYLVVDCSASLAFRSLYKSKYETICEVAAVLALVADFGKDQVGLIRFSDRLESYVPPARGRAHVQAIIKQLFEVTPSVVETNYTVAFEHILRLKAKNAIIFFLSDFIDFDVTSQMRVVRSLCDLIGVRCSDPYEQQFPNVGLLAISGFEKEAAFSGVSSLAVNRMLMQYAHDHQHMRRSSGIDWVDVQTDRSVVADIMRFFARRMSY